MYCSPTVTACLNSGKRVLGVLQQGDVPMTQEIAARGDVLLLTVTPENRDRLADVLRAWARG